MNIKFAKTNNNKWRYVLLEPAAIKNENINFGTWKAYGTGKISKGKLLIEAKGNTFIVYPGYAWDGCTCAPDADWNYRASLFHDAMYQAKKCGAKTTTWTNIDLIFSIIMKQDGAPLLPRGIYYGAVRTVGALWKICKDNSLEIK